MPDVKRALICAVDNPIGQRLLAQLERLGNHLPNHLSVLTYHRIELPEAFDRQMAYLAASTHVVSVRQILDSQQGGEPLPARSVAVTFDDAYVGFAKEAWPILKRYRLPVTLFVPTAFPDHPERVFWWDRLRDAFTRTTRRDPLELPIAKFRLAKERQRQRSYARVSEYLTTLRHEDLMSWTDRICDLLGVPPPPQDVLGWEALRVLAAEGVSLGAHTRSHPLLTRVPLERARAEIVGSLRDLETETGVTDPVFAYPDGRFNSEITRIVRDAGVALAFTTLRGTNDLRNVDPLRLRRNHIGGRATLAILQANLLRTSVYFNRLRPLASAQD